MELRELMDREYNLAARDIERGAPVIPFVVATNARGEEYIIPFHHIVGSDQERMAWVIAFKLFACMQDLTQYVVVSEAWVRKIERPLDDPRKITQEDIDRAPKQEILNITGISRNEKMAWSADIVRDGSLVVCNRRDEHEDTDEIGGLMTELLPPLAASGRMPETFKPKAYEAIKAGQLFVISR